MSLKLYLKFQNILKENNLENKLDVNKSLAIAEDIALMESVPERITEKLTELYGEEKMLLLIESVKEQFKDDFEDEEIEETEDVEDEEEVEESDDDDNDDDDDDDDDDDEDDDDDDEEVDEVMSLFKTYTDKIVEELFNQSEKGVDEAMRPKKLTGAKKKAKEAKSQVMALLKKDPEVKGIMDKAKKKIIQKAKAIGKKAGIRVNRINFDKIKL